MELIQFAVIGSGWRAEFFLAVSRELTSHFKVAGLVTRDAAKGATLEQKWGIKLTGPWIIYTTPGRQNC